MFNCLILLAIIGYVCQNGCESARILGIFPTPLISHQTVYRKLTVELSKRGHELVIFTSHPLNDRNMKNYTEIDMHRASETWKDFFPGGESFWYIWTTYSRISAEIAEMFLSSPEMQRIIEPENKERFDLVLIEYWGFYSLHAIAERLGTPLVGITSMGLNYRLHHLIGNPHALAYTPGIRDPVTDDLDFMGRLKIASRNVLYQLIEYFVRDKLHDRLLEKYFGPDMPKSNELGKNVEIVLVNEYVALGYPRPTLPNYIRVGGLGLDRRRRGLDEELKRFLDDAVNGFVYFSLGSNQLSKFLRCEKIEALVEAFAELPYRVLWKWELDTLPGKPDNVYISKWLPQYDVLAHPNIKVFFYQGGLQSTEEAIDNAVPLIGSPVWADQEYNVRKIESIGLGKLLSSDDLYDSDKIRDAIIEVATDERYEKNMLKFRDLVFDEPETPLERAVWWTEYVIRNNGTPHLKTRVRHMSWYQRELLDVLLLTLILISLACFAVYKLILCLLKLSFALLDYRIGKSKVE